MSNLSQQQKNDIIATRICGWQSNEHNYYDEAYGIKSGSLFMPTHSLDDCFLAEEKMPEELRGKYARALCVGGEYTANNWNEIFLYLHTSAEERVNAMLKALDIS